ncbi:DUF2730 family protein [Psychrobacter sp. APC 3279]|uniref:DUF2730 family protein n=1 Tax=Psychrobacter sp. APC 3279 TaxID=3035189 RepID=UPI0025B48C5E|nr:DUF2730 family protein [Psychrobacter sp. APC 3279]MDN3441093.1 DUF2730 family protein [Psychrobacter sp. APC 3279]
MTVFNETTKRDIMQKYDIQLAKFAFDIVQTVVMVGISIYVWLMTNHKANSTRIRDLESRHDSEIDELDTRLTSIETKLDAMPNQQSMNTLHKRINSQSQTLHKIEGELKGIADNNAMILEKLLKN